MDKKKRKKRAKLVITIKFPVHKEIGLSGIEEIIAPMEYKFEFVWGHFNHMSGSKEDAEYIQSRLLEYREFEIENKMKQIIFYYQRTTGAKETNYEKEYEVVFED